MTSHAAGQSTRPAIPKSTPPRVAKSTTALTRLFTNNVRARISAFTVRENQFLREHALDDFTEAQCASFYAETMGRPGLPPGIYFRLLLIGYFEGIVSERGIAWRAADSLALRDFIGAAWRTRRPITRPFRGHAV
jgi:Transposase domain (DUF772)